MGPSCIVRIRNELYKKTVVDNYYKEINLISHIFLNLLLGLINRFFVAVVCINVNLVGSRCKVM